MSHPTFYDIVTSLYGGGDSAARVNALCQVVIDLLVEVEALREALLQLCPETQGSHVHKGYDIPCHDDTLTKGKGAYQAAYVNAAYVRHNAAGPFGAIEKLLARFYAVDGTVEIEPRELLMLRRLGFSEEEIVRFRAAVRKAEQFS
jgi:hypothetical protein